MMFIAMLLAQAAALPVPSPEAVELGTRIARKGLFVDLPRVAFRVEADVLTKRHPGITVDDQSTLLRIGRSLAERHREQFLQDVGRRYAATMSLADLRVVASFMETPAADRWAMNNMKVTREAMEAARKIDYTGEMLEAFCKETGRACPKN